MIAVAPDLSLAHDSTDSLRLGGSGKFPGLRETRSPHHCITSTTAGAVVPLLR